MLVGGNIDCFRGMELLELFVIDLENLYRLDLLISVLPDLPGLSFFLQAL